jgi:hypothetical protein
MSDLPANKSLEFTSASLRKLNSSVGGMSQASLDRPPEVARRHVKRIGVFGSVRIADHLKNAVEVLEAVIDRSHRAPQNVAILDDAGVCLQAFVVVEVFPYLTVFSFHCFLSLHWPTKTANQCRHLTSLRAEGAAFVGLYIIRRRPPHRRNAGVQRQQFRNLSSIRGCFVA